MAKQPFNKVDGFYTLSNIRSDFENSLNIRSVRFAKANFRCIMITIILWEATV